MTQPSQDRLWQAFEATWPALATRTQGPWTLRDGAGGGKRVSAATRSGTVTESDIDAAETAMRDDGVTPLFLLRSEDSDLDARLDARGYEVVDPTDILIAPTERLTDHVPPRLTAIEVFPPLAIMAEIWAAGGIGPERIAVMMRASDPKISFLGRHKDRAVGACFAGAAEGIAFVHALEILPDYRRMGVARNMMAAAAHWAVAQGAPYLAVAVTQANRGAQTLYASLGLTAVEKYHYRRATEAGEGLG